MQKEERDYIRINPAIYQLDSEWKMTNDLLFKYIFGRELPESKLLLIDLINTVKRLEGVERIVEITYNNPFNLQEYIGDKLSVTDIKVTTAGGVKYNVEMQVAKQVYYMARSLLYWCALYSEGIGEGDFYNDLKKTVSIHFLDHQLFPDKSKAHEIVHLKNQDNEKMTDLLEMHYIQIPLMDVIMKEEEELFDWITLMKDIANPSKRQEVERIINSREVMKVAFTQFEKAMADKQLRRKMEDELKAKRDLKAQLGAAHEDGVEAGIERGIEQGIEQGIEKGIEQGQLQMVKKLIKMNCSFEMIQEASGLDEETIRLMINSER